MILSHNNEIGSLHEIEYTVFLRIMRTLAHYYEISYEDFWAGKGLNKFSYVKL